LLKIRAFKAEEPLSVHRYPLSAFSKAKSNEHGAESKNRNHGSRIFAEPREDVLTGFTGSLGSFPKHKENTFLILSDLLSLGIAPPLGRQAQRAFFDRIYRMLGIIFF
jgi:hypothetical protein